MTLSIFCPNNHLILDAPRCPKCGWERPAPTDIGQPLWEPLALGVGLGGPGRHVFARPGAAQGMAVFPSRDREIIGIDISTGKVSWRKRLESGRNTRAVLSGQNRLLTAISDERSLGKSEHGYLAAIDPVSGNMTTLWQAGGH